MPIMIPPLFPLHPISGWGVIYLSIHQFKSFGKMWTILPNRGKKTTIYAHNVGYDINATKAIHNLVKLGYILTSAFDKGSYILTMRKVIDDKHAKVITFYKYW